MKCEVQKIHEATMRILGRTGIKFHHPDAVQILKQHGIRMDGNIAYFTEEELMYWVHKTPSHINLYGKEKDFRIVLGGGHSESAPSSGSPQICDPAGKKRNALIEDYVKLTKLYEANNHHKINGGIIVFPSDVPVDSAALLMYFAAFTHSDKVLMTGTGNYEQMEALMKLACLAYESEENLRKYPRLLTIINVNTPLQLDHIMTETLLTFGKYGQPVAVASAAMAGTTSPITLAGTIALTNAEVLSTIALAQMANPGTPLLYASQSTTADLRNGSIAIGAPEGALCYEYCAKLAKFYGLPCRGGGALSDSKIVNAQSGYESMLTYLVCRQNDMNLIVHSAGILDSYTCVSYEKLITDFEVIDYVDRYLKGVEVTSETIPEDLIDELAHNGQYLIEEHTFEFCRKEPLTPKVSIRGAVENPARQYEENIEKREKQLLSSYQRPTRDNACIKAMKELLVKRGIEQTLLDQIEEI